MSIRTYFENIADAIREKDTDVTTLTPAEMPNAILNIPSGGGVEIIDYINPMGSKHQILFSNWIFNLSDKFEIIYKQTQAPTGNWPPILYTNKTNALYLNYNLWGGRTVMNLRYNNSYSGDGSVSYNSPYDYNNFYKLTGDAGSFVLTKGETIDNINTVAFTYNFTSASGSTGDNVAFLNAKGDAYYLYCNFYGIKVYNSENVLIHDYKPAKDENSNYGFFDDVDKIFYCWGVNVV